MSIEENHDQVSFHSFSIDNTKIPYIVLQRIMVKRKNTIPHDRTNSDGDFRCLPLSSSTRLGVLEPLPKRSKAFNMSSGEILFSFPEFLSISFKSLRAKNRRSRSEKSFVSY